MRVPRRHRFRAASSPAVLVRALGPGPRFRFASGADGPTRFGADPVAILRAGPDERPDARGAEALLVERVRALLPRVPSARPEAPGGAIGRDALPFPGGVVGWIGWERGLRAEGLVPQRVEPDRPELWLGLFDTFATWDPGTREVEVVSWGWRPDGGFDGRLALRRAEALEERLRAADPGTGDGGRAPGGRAPGPPATGPRLSLDREGHAARVATIREAIAAGEFYQADLTVRFDVPCALPATELFERLLADNPAPYSACVETDEGAVVSSSPERLLAVRGRSVATGPIKGTMARPPDPAAEPEADRAAAAALLASPKDRAELLMITDLLRNDLGKVCRPGTVRCPRLREVESFAHVHHLVSTIVGELPPGRDALDALVAVFPGGSIAGAPKRRAMEWLTRLETAPRGVYTGTVGWMGFDGSAEWNVAIRTGRLADGTLSFGAGGGIVWDSTPAEEWRELHWKARAFLRAVGAAEDASLDGAPATTTTGGGP